MDHLATDPPGCWMNYTGSWQATSVRDATGGDVGFFVLPPITPSGDAPLLGSASMIGAIRDRPEVREFVRQLLDPEWGASWAADPTSHFLSANQHFDPARCRAPGLSDDANAVRVQTLPDATRHHRRRAPTLRRLRRDARRDRRADAMRDQRGAFLQGMLDYVDNGPASLDSSAPRHRRRMAVAPSIGPAYDLDPATLATLITHRHAVGEPASDDSFVFSDDDGRTVWNRNRVTILITSLLSRQSNSALTRVRSRRVLSRSGTRPRPRRGRPVLAAMRSGGTSRRSRAGCRRCRGPTS